MSKRKKSQVLDAVHISYLRDKNGQFWWAETSDPAAPPDGAFHGPFRTEADCEDDMRRVALGGLEVKDTGQVLHEAPERKQ